jgi:hypothetical protein
MRSKTQRPAIWRRPCAVKPPLLEWALPSNDWRLRGAIQASATDITQLLLKHVRQPVILE